MQSFKEDRTRRTFARSIAFLAVAALAAGPACSKRKVAQVEPRQSVEQVKDIPVEINRDIDILFVVDNSASMAEEQASLQQNFNRFINVLSNIEGGLPNVHVGVISTDVGAGPFTISDCSGNGDNGTLQNTPRGPGCNPPAGRFISDIGQLDGSRVTNYTGDLADAFNCIAHLGTHGCGFEQPLESMRRALNGSNNRNAGFLRPGAFLAIIFITDEDDCSTKDTQMFNPSPSLNSVDGPLGPLSSFRCFDFGVKCMPDTPRQTGAKADCVPREDSKFLFGVVEYIDFLKHLKDDPNQVIVAGIIGNDTPVIVGTDVKGNPNLKPSCQSASGVAAPGVRMKAFLDAFPQRSTITTICDEDLSGALAGIAERLRKAIGSPCLDGKIKQPIECVVSDVRFPGEDRQEETIRAKCVGDPTSTTERCWVIEEDGAQCSDTDTHLKFTMYPKNGTVPSGTHTVVRCVVQG